MWRDFKYMIAYIGPLSAFLGLYFGGVWSLGVVYIAFGIIPILEFVLPFDLTNVDESKEESRSNFLFFDLLLYIHVPLLYGILYFFFHILTTRSLTNFEYFGMTLNVGILLGAFGINVAHELGHRAGKLDALMARLLLIPCLYNHFTIEHNVGHHKHVSTPEDPSSARKNEALYVFWIRSVVGVYKGAWQIENRRISRAGEKIFSLSNQMIQNTFFTLLYLGLVYYFFGLLVLGLAVVAGVISFLLLETVNYIEHYGLTRKKIENGTYERVTMAHSWNSEHEMGRIFLYELTRHADHHYKAARKYQILRHYEKSPQLPLGYPGSMLLSFIPPLWFKFMNPRIPN
jgi:alkane 1-monooxygenase